MMADVNADLIAVNKAIIEGNEEVVAFNAAQIITNTNLLSGIIHEDKATVEANAKRIVKNKEKIANVKAKNETYNQGMAEKHGLIIENREKIEANAAKIKE